MLGGILEAMERHKLQEHGKDMEIARKALLDTFDGNERRAVASVVAYIEGLKILGWKLVAKYQKGDDVLEVQVVEPDDWDGPHVCEFCSKDTL